MRRAVPFLAFFKPHTHASSTNEEAKWKSIFKSIPLPFDPKATRHFLTSFSCWSILQLTAHDSSKKFKILPIVDISTQILSHGIPFIIHIYLSFFVRYIQYTARAQQIPVPNYCFWRTFPCAMVIGLNRQEASKQRNLNYSQVHQLL